MTRQEAIALGVPEERLNEFQELYHRDLRRAVQKQEYGSTKPIRAAINSMLSSIKDVDKLREVLVMVTEIYCRPIKAKPEEHT